MPNYDLMVNLKGWEAQNMTVDENRVGWGSAEPPKGMIPKKMSWFVSMGIMSDTILSLFASHHA